MVKRELRTLKHRRNDLSRELDQLLKTHLNGEPWNKAKYCQLTSSILTLQEQIQQLKKPPRERVPERPQIDKTLKAIEQQYLQTIDAPLPLLRCPRCGDADHNNRMNGTPWCIRCDVALTTSKEHPELERIHVLRREVAPTFHKIDTAMDRRYRDK